MKAIPTAIGLIALCASVGAAAQTVTLVAPKTMQFTDTQYGVSFRYPASWTFSEAPALGSIYDSTQRLRGAVFVRKIHGVVSWPETNFAGDELEYAVSPAASPKTCKKLALSPTDVQGGVNQETIGRVVWNHDSSDIASLGREALEDEYTEYTRYYTGSTGQPGGSCLLFSLVVHYSNNRPGNSPPRALTTSELKAARGDLDRVFSTVHVDLKPTRQFTDPQYGVSFQYPTNWTMRGTQQSYIPEAILAPGNDQNPIASARAVVVADNKEWPELTKQKGFYGAELVFNVFPGFTISDCIKRLPPDQGFKTAGTKTIDGLRFSLVQGANAGGCHDSRESIYVYQASHSCYYFDLAVHTGCPADGGPFLTAEALQPVDDQLESVLATVRIHPPQNSK